MSPKIQYELNVFLYNFKGGVAPGQFEVLLYISNVQDVMYFSGVMSISIRISVFLKTL